MNKQSELAVVKLYRQKDQIQGGGKGTTNDWPCVRS